MATYEAICKATIAKASDYTFASEPGAMDAINASMAAQGILWATTSGRVSGMVERKLRALDTAGSRALIAEIAGRKLLQAYVPRFLVEWAGYAY